MAADQAGRGVRVAVIDSGVNADHPHVNGVAGGVAIDAAGRVSGDYVDRIGHGTAVMAAIKEKAPGAECYAVRIFERRLSTSAAALVAAIDWATDHDVHVINLSLGTSNPAHAPALRAAVERARAAGVAIVSASDDDGIAWLPGSLPGVIGVQVDWECPRDQFRIVRAGTEVVFRASGFARPIAGVDPRMNLHGVSFAVANITGFLVGSMDRSEHGGRDPMTILAQLASTTYAAHAPEIATAAGQRR